jgi:predicted DsbA family dithiol-disulfide isomerase
MGRLSTCSWMDDYIYEHQQALDDNHLEKYAGKLGLDLARFNHDMSSHAYARHIREDFLSGVRSGVNGSLHSACKGKQ